MPSGSALGGSREPEVDQLPLSMVGDDKNQPEIAGDFPYFSPPFKGESLVWGRNLIWPGWFH